jgi:hypothetical protein
VQAQQGTSRVVVVPAGPGQALDGRRAAAYATYLAAGEADAAQQARFTEVLRATFAALPDGHDEVRTTLEGLPASTSTLPVDDLARVLSSLREAVRGDDVAYPALPVVADDIGDDGTTYRLDVDDLESVLAGPFADSLPPEPPGGDVEVLVQNGVGTAGLVDAARTRLRAADLRFENGGNANRFGFAETVVIVPDESEVSRRRGQLVTRALGVPDTAVVVGDQAAGVADVLVVLGADFTP